MSSGTGSTIAHPYENQGPTILGATLTVTIAALITVITRLWVRINLIKNVGWDDYTMIAAMVLCLVIQAVIIPEVHYGAGKHIDHIDPKDFSTAFKLNFVTQPFCLFATCMVKQSVGFFLLRVAVTPFYRRAIISIMVFMAVYTIACFMTVVLQCTDLRVQWDSTVHATCWSPSTLKGLSYTNVALNILTDLLFAVIIPIPMLWQVQMNTRQKASVIAILGLGIFATAAALVKTSYLPDYGKTGDWLWDSRNLTIWNVVESNVGIIAGSLPCLKPLFRRVLGSSYGSKKTGTPHYNSRPYGAGTNHHSVRGFQSLHSNKTHGGESHELDGITHKGKSNNARLHASKASSLDGSVGNESAESVAWLNENMMGKMGGITKTTEVNVSGETRGVGEGSDFENERKERHIV